MALVRGGATEPGSIAVTGPNTTQPVHGHPAGAPAAPAAPANGLAAFANSDMGKQWAAVNQAYGPTTMPAYSNAWQGAIAAARGNVAQQLNGALADIQTHQNLAEQALGQYAPQVNAAYAAGQGMINNAQQAGASALSRYGVGTQVANADLAPERIAMQTTHAGDLADQSLLNTGIQEETNAQRGAAQQQAADAQNQIAMQQASFQQAQAMQSQQEQYNHDSALRDFGLGMVSKAQDFRDTQALDRTRAATAANTNPGTGQYAASGLTQSQIDSAHQNPQYHSWAQELNGVQAGSAEAALLAGNIQYSLASNPSLLATLTSEYPQILGSGAKVNPMIKQGGKTGYMVKTKVPYGSNSFLGRVQQGERGIGQVETGIGNWLWNQS